MLFWITDRIILEEKKDLGLKKQLNLIDYAFQNIRVYRVRTLSILISVGLITGMLTSIDILRDGINQDVEASLAFSPDILIQGYDSGRVVPVNNSIISIIEQIDGVSHVSPRIWGYLSAANRLYILMGLEVGRYPLNNSALDFEMQNGEFLHDNETGYCVIGSGVAEASKALVGSILLLSDINGEEHEFEVCGIFSVSSKIYTHDLIITDIESSRNFFNLDTNHSTDIAIWTESSTVPPSIVISEEVENIKLIDKDTLGDLLLHSNNEKAGFFAVVWAVLFIGSLLFAFTLSSAVSFEARREIGLLKTLGFSISDVLEIRVIEYALSGFIASTVGIFCAIIFDFYLGAPILSDFMLGWSVLFPPFTLPLRLTVEQIAVAYGIGVIPLVIATVVPAWKNAITEPEEVLRGL
jgi:ABC-type lipoprotein release transport system permease subunit